MTDSDDPRTIDLYRRRWELQRDAGRVLAAAQARLIEAYESSPDRALHALSWEHLPGRVGSSRPISERDEASAAKSSDSAKRVVQTSMLHDGEVPLSEYSQLLDDWGLISSRAEEESFKLDEYLGSSHCNWQVTGEGLIPNEGRRLRGWSIEDLEGLRSRDPELVSEYRRELEGDAVAHAEKGNDFSQLAANREIWVDARLADIDSAVESKMLLARANDLEAQLSRWKQIEHMRALAEDRGRRLLFWDVWDQKWDETPEDVRPEMPIRDKREFPDSLTLEMKRIYDATEQKQNQVWLTGLRREVIDEFQVLVDQLVALSKELPTTPGIAREMAERENRRSESDNRFGPRVPIPTDFGWYEYFSLEIDDEANFAREIEDDVRRSGNLWIHWAKELVGMLPAVTKRAVELGKHPISDIPKDSVPKSLSVLFEQAHLCYIFNLEIPCVMTCGSLIEDAIETRFPELKEEWQRRQWANKKSVPWRAKLEEVARAYPPFETVWGVAYKVVQKRNVAVHDPTKYLNESKGQSEQILRGTRDVLKALFETGQPNEGRN